MSESNERDNSAAAVYIPTWLKKALIKRMTDTNFGTMKDYLTYLLKNALRDDAKHTIKIGDDNNE